MSSTIQRVDLLRQAATWLLWGMAIIVLDFRIGGGVTPGADFNVSGPDVITDVVGAVLVVVGVLRLRDAAQDVPDTHPWLDIARITAFVHVPLVVAEEVTFVTGTEDLELVVSLLSLPVVFGGTAATAYVFHRATAHLTHETELNERWRRTVWWVALGGGVPATVTTLMGIGLSDGPSQVELGGLAVVAFAGFAVGLIALIQLVIALWRTRQLADPVPAVAPPG